MTLQVSKRGWCCWALGLASAAVFVFSAAAVTGCAADEPVGHTKTVRKTTEETPSGTTTTTDTREKDTKIIDRP
jgi:hypothetical protein